MMELDPDAMLKEAQTLITALQQRVLFLAGRLGAVEKQLAQQPKAPDEQRG